MEPEDAALGAAPALAGGAGPEAEAQHHVLFDFFLRRCSRRERPCCVGKGLRVLSRRKRPCRVAQVLRILRRRERRHWRVEIFATVSRGLRPRTPARATLSGQGKCDGDVRRA